MSLPGAEAPDPLVTQTAKKLADVLNDLRAQVSVNNNGSHRTHVFGKIKLTLASHCYTLNIGTTDLAHDIKVQVQPLTVDTIKGSELPQSTSNRSSATATNSSIGANANVTATNAVKRPADDAEVSVCKKVRFETDTKTKAVPTGVVGSTKHHNITVSTKPATDHASDVTADDLSASQLLSEHTEHNDHLFAQTQPPSNCQGIVPRHSVNLHTETKLPNAPKYKPLHSSLLQQHVAHATLTPKHMTLFSQQIKWVDECRRVATQFQEDRENAWRHSDATFHTRQQQNHQAFQIAMIEKTDAQTRMLVEMAKKVDAMAAFVNKVSEVRKKKAAVASKSKAGK